MLNEENIKVGQFVKWVGGFRCGIECIVSVNSKYAYTNQKNRIYPKDYNYYIALSDEEAKAESIHCLNDEIQDLLSNVQDLLSNVQDLQEEIYKLNNLPYFTIDTDELESDLEDIVDRIREVLREYERLD